MKILPINHERFREACRVEINSGQQTFTEKLLCFKLSLGQNIALGGCGIHNTSAVVFNLSPKALAHAKCLILLLDQIET